MRSSPFLNRLTFFSLFFIFLNTIFLTTSAHASVRYEGISTFELQQLKSRLPDLNSSNPSYATLDKAMRYLMNLGTYSKVSVYKTSDNTRVLVAISLKRLKEIEIVGNHEFSDEEILTAMGLKLGAKFDAAKVASATEDLKEFYGLRGYLNTIVSFQFEDAKANDLKMVVRIREREPCIIEKFTFKTNNVDLVNKLKNKLKRNTGNNFSEENLLESEQKMEELLADKRYINTVIKQSEAKYNTNKTSVELVYEVSDPYSFEFLFKGNEQIRSGEIIAALKLEEFSHGSSDPARDLNQKIREHYISQGYPHARTQFREKIIASDFRKILMFEIEEGPRVRIKEIEVLGRISRESRYYTELILENSSDVVEDKFFVRAGIDNGVQNLIISLNNEGFLKAKIQSVRVEYSANRDTATVIVLLDEGPLTQLTKVTIAGTSSFTQKQLMGAMDVTSQAPLRLNALESSIQKVKDFYRSRGFLEMRIENEESGLINYDESGLKASVHFQIIEGPQIFAKRIVVDGNTFTKDYVVLKEVNIDPGDLLTPELLDEGRKRLEKLGIFTRVDLRTLEANTNVSHRTLIISVTERNPGLFRMGAGLTNKRDLTARGYAGISYINLGGTARAISLRGTVESGIVNENYLEYETTVGYLEPFLFDSKFRGRANYSRSEKVIDDIKVNDEDVLQIRSTDRITFSVERDITSKIKFTWLMWGLDSTEQFLSPNPLNEDATRLRIAYIGPSLDIDYRDNPFLPTKGTFTKIDTEYASPFLGSSDKVEFVRSQATFTHYKSLFSSRWVWANSVRGGYEKNLSTEAGSGVPVSYAFFLGDYTTIRGYSGSRTDRVPNNGEFPIDNTEQLAIPGESTYYLMKSEVRFPLGSGPFGGVLFYDAGEVAIQGFDFEDPFKQSYGIGVRVNTPVGPISLDYGRKIAPREDESPDHWHLSIGTF